MPPAENRKGTKSDDHAHLGGDRRGAQRPSQPELVATGEMDGQRQYQHRDQVIQTQSVAGKDDDGREPVRGQQQAYAVGQQALEHEQQQHVADEQR